MAKICRDCDITKKTVLYHGTIRSFAESIVRDGINVNINRGAELDFGSGFYFSDRRTAIRLARSKEKEREKMKVPDEDTSPVVLRLYVDLDGLHRLKTHTFKRKGKDWFNFVFDTRCKKQENDYDLIEGPMADGAVNSVMGKYNSKPGIFRKFIVWINYMCIEGIGHVQYVAKTEKAVKYITIVEIEEA